MKLSMQSARLVWLGLLWLSVAMGEVLAAEPTADKFHWKDKAAEARRSSSTTTYS